VVIPVKVINYTKNLAIRIKYLFFLITRFLLTSFLYICYKYIGKLDIINMMPVVRIPDLIYQRLQAIAIPFEDTPLTVIERLLSEYEARQKPQQSGDIETQKSEEGEKYLVLDPEASSNLRHTRVIRSVIGGKEIRQPNWSKILDEAHILAWKQGLSSEALIKLSLARVVKGESNDPGFHYLREIDISIQGVEANLAWRNTLHLSKNLNIPVEVYFEWRMKEGSAYPGQKGKLIWIPK